MKILFVTYDLPYPLDSGGKVRAYNLIKELAKEHKVTLFSYYRDNSQLNYVDKLRKYCVNVHLFMRTELFSLKHIANTMFHPNLTAHISHYYHKDLQQELKKELKNGAYDLLHLESFYTSYLLGEYGITQVLGTENIEWQVYQQHAETKPKFIQLPLSLEAMRTRLFERSTWKKADSILAVSPSDTKEIKAHTAKPVYEIPNGVDLDYFKFNIPKMAKQKNLEHIRFLYVGDYSYIQNKDTVAYLLKDIYPVLKEKYPKSTLTIVGKNISRKLDRKLIPGAKIRRSIEDIRVAYSNADILLAPLRIGSGTQFKLLEAMAMGVIVATTAVGSEGLNARNGRELVVFKGRKDVVEVISSIVTDSKRAGEIAKQAREFIEKEYSWNVIGTKLRSIYSQLTK